ncbi:MAG: hypothetical protein QM809_04655 [Gordonia sp. (in: high G+C Gram-positive bacteria)]|uniref:hypothetical protein n=1 Tax=Gordonia sp. (in: high G+C Gram-positive bacteria) TaxID=84139 RepID=UPI0039E41DD1
MDPESAHDHRPIDRLAQFCRRRRIMTGLWWRRHRESVVALLDDHRYVLTGITWAFAALTAVFLTWLAVVAAWPDVRASAPGWIAWLGDPSSSLTTLVVLTTITVTIRLRWRSHRRMPSGSVPLILGALSLATFGLGWASYAHCVGGEASAARSFFAALSQFVGNVTDLEATCKEPGVYPAALDVFRILAILILISAAWAIGARVFQAQLDRARIRRGALTVVVGIDDDALTMVRAIAKNPVPGTELVVITADADRDCVRAARALGARIVETDLAEAENLAELPIWHRAETLHLLSDDPQHNIDRFTEIDGAVKSRVRDDSMRLRVPLTMRIDDPWHAEHWRRRLMRDARGRWAPDAIGRYEVTSARLAREIRRNDRGKGVPARRVYIDASPALTHTLLSEFVQLGREIELFDQVAKGHDAERRLRTPFRPPLPEIVLLGPDAEGLRAEFRSRDDARFDPEGFTLTVDDRTPTVEGLDRLLREVDDCAAEAVVLILERDDDRSLSDGTRLAARHPRIRLFVGGEPVKSFSRTAVLGDLRNFPLSLELEDDAPHDVWERAARLNHELYRMTTEYPEARGSRPWTATDREPHALHDFYKGSNRRQVTNALWMMEGIADCTWASHDGAPQTAAGATVIDDSGSYPDAFSTAHRLGVRPADFDRILRYEHKDWRIYHLKQGWKHANVDSTDFDNRIRNDLDGSYPTDLGKLESNANSMLSVFRALVAHGFRPMPKWHALESSDSEFVEARRAVPGEVLDGDVEHPAAADDHVVRDGDGRVRIVSRTDFEAVVSAAAPLTDDPGSTSTGTASR